jgi:hypothetical protein
MSSIDTSNSKSFLAASTITQYQLVKFDTAGKVSPATDPTSSATLGVALNGGDAGEYITVQFDGEVTVIAGATITNFATTPLLAVMAGGKVQAAVAGDYPVCAAVPNINQVSAVDGDQIQVTFSRPSTVI